MSAETFILDVKVGDVLRSTLFWSSNQYQHNGQSVMDVTNPIPPTALSPHAHTRTFVIVAVETTCDSNGPEGVPVSRRAFAQEIDLVCEEGGGASVRPRRERITFLVNLAPDRYDVPKLKAELVGRVTVHPRVEYSFGEFTY